MFYAEMTTENFTFRAVAATAEEAKRAILKGWKKHQKQYKFVSEYKTVPQLDGWYGINTFPMEMGECLRDHDALK